MAEYSAQMAARQTRAAIAAVKRALDRLYTCANHFADLDESLRRTVEFASEVPSELCDLVEELDEVYPVKPTRNKTTRRNS